MKLSKKPRPKKHQIINELKSFAKTSDKSLTTRQVNKLLQAYDLNIVIAIEKENLKLENQVKDLEENNKWLRQKLDQMYISINSYCKRVDGEIDEFLKQKNILVTEVERWRKIFARASVFERKDN